MSHEIHRSAVALNEGVSCSEEALLNPIEPLADVSGLSIGRLAERRVVRSMVRLRWELAFAATTIFVVSGHLLIKAGLNAVTEPIGMGTLAQLANYIFQPMVFGGLAIYSVGCVCWMIAVSKTELSFLYPLTSLNYVLIVLISSILFQEPVSGRRLAGVLLIVGGVVLMNRDPLESQR